MARVGPGGAGTWANARWEGRPAITALRDMPTWAAFATRLSLPPGSTGSAQWKGFLVVDRAGGYSFDITTDDRAWLWIDKTLVVSHDPQPGVPAPSGVVALNEGPHPITIRYAHGGGPRMFVVNITGPDGIRSALDAGRVTPSAVAARAGWWRAIASRLPVGLASVWAGLMLYLPVRLGLAWALATVRPIVRTRRARLAAWALLACGAVLLAWGITWGLPPDRHTWAADESDPDGVIEILRPRPIREWPALAWYPPLYYYATAPPVAAFVLADRLGTLPRTSESWQTAALVFMRVTTLLMALATLVAVAACAAEAAGAAAAGFAALALLLTPAFLYYGKTTNVDVPYLVWVSVAMLAFVRIIRRNLLRDYLVLGVAAAAAIATKDQAYGFFVFVPLAVVIVNAQHRAREGHAAPWRHLLIDRKLWYAGALSIAVYATLYNMAFNWRGWVEHITLIRGFGDAARQFPGTCAGQLGLARHTTVLLRWSMGWPLLLLAAVGVVRALGHRNDRWLLWLLGPVASYYLAFIAVGGAAYDRFLLGVMAILAVFAGVACAWLWRSPRRVLGRGLVAAGVLYSLSYAVSIDVMLTRDARYTAEAWMDSHVPRDEPVGLLAPIQYLPRLRERPRLEIEPVLESLAGQRPCVIVANTRYAARFGQTEAGQALLAALADGSLGCREAFRHRGSLPSWATLQYESWMRASHESGYSNLDKINPEIVIYRCCAADQRH